MACKCAQACKHTQRRGSVSSSGPLSSTFNICRSLKCLLKHLYNVSCLPARGKSFVESEEVLSTLSKHTEAQQQQQQQQSSRHSGL